MCIQSSMRLDERVPLEDHMEVVVLDVLESCPCVYIYIRLCWNKNEKGNSRDSYAWKRADDAGGRGPIFLILLWGRSEWGARQVRFFWTYKSWLSVLVPTNPWVGMSKTYVVLHTVSMWLVVPDTNPAKSIQRRALEWVPGWAKTLVGPKTVSFERLFFR